MRAFDIGLSALRAQQKNLSVLGNNLANASTPGYHRQRVDLATRAPVRNDQFYVGAGVEITGISRLRDDAIEAALLRNATEVGSTGEMLGIARQIESMLTPGDGTVHASMSSFFNRLEMVANAPQDVTARREFLSAASELVSGFNHLDQKLSSLANDIRQSLDDGIKQVNQLITDVAELNARIFQARALGTQPNDMLDRRDQLLGRLSEWVATDLVAIDGNRDQVLLGGGVVVIGFQPVTLRAKDYSNGTTAISVNELPTPIPLTSGRLDAMTTAINETIPEFRDRLRDLSQTLVRNLDQQHAQGIPTQGPYSLIVGTRSVSHGSLPLSLSAAELPITAGSLYMTVTETATGSRTTHRIDINPATDTLEDVAGKISAAAGVTASVDPVRRTLTISSGTAWAVDFAGRPDNAPDLTSMSGTSVPSFGGLYTGSRNDEWTVTFSGAGTIGGTKNLTAEVRNSAGLLIGNVNIGTGYESGSPITLANGVTITFSAGTIEASDSTSVFVVRSSDETGILSALGINSLFTGSAPGMFQVRQELLRDPDRLAVSLTGAPGDGINIATMAAFRDLRLSALGNRTFTEELAAVTADSGLLVRAIDNQYLQLQAFQTQLSADRDAVSGVDINQEMLEMMETQRAYQAAARFLTTADQMMLELFELVR